MENQTGLNAAGKPSQLTSRDPPGQSSTPSGLAFTNGHEASIVKFFAWVRNRYFLGFSPFHNERPLAPLGGIERADSRDADEVLPQLAVGTSEPTRENCVSHAESETQVDASCAFSPITLYNSDPLQDMHCHADVYSTIPAKKEENISDIEPCGISSVTTYYPR